MTPITTKRERTTALLMALLVLFLMTGCVDLENYVLNEEIGTAIAKYHDVAPQVTVGTTKKEALAILSPTQSGLRPQLQKPPEQWRSATTHHLIELYYFRTNHVRDGRTTDEEFTPYLFIDETLEAIGWRAVQQYTKPPAQQSSAQAQARKEDRPSRQSPSPAGQPAQSLLPSATSNAYGPGIHRDATGRPFTYQPQFGGSGYPDPTLRVQPNAYGPGVGMDQYGRPVQAKPWP